MIDLLAGPWGPVVIFVLRVIDVSLGTMRFLLLTRRARIAPPMLGFIEVLIWITAAGAAIRNLNSPLHLIGYAGGFGAGTWVGMWLEERIALGTVTVQAYCRKPQSGVATKLRALNLGVTEIEGRGLGGPVDIISTVVRRQLVPRVIESIETQDPDAFVAVYDARAHGGWFPRARRK